MNPTHIPVIAAIALATTSWAGDTAKQVVPPTEPEKWQFSLSLPAWGTWLEGDTGLNGKSAHVDLGPGDIIPRIDMAVDIRAEAHKGRLSILSEFLYLGLSDGIGTGTVVKKLDVQIDQTMAELGVGWRIIDSPKGYLDVIGGVRYTNFYQKVALQPNDERINEVAGRIAVAGTAARALLARELRALRGEDPTVPIAPLRAGEADRLAKAIARIKGNTAARQARIAARLHDALGSTQSRTDDWLDPYIGLRGRYNLNEKFYLSGRADIGGFGVGSEFTWQAEAGIGMMMTKNIFTELGYRAIGVDYDDNGFSMDTITHGVQLTLGVVF